MYQSCLSELSVGFGGVCFWGALIKCCRPLFLEGEDAQPLSAEGEDAQCAAALSWRASRQCSGVNTS
jgi:hypothetical protein